MRYKVLFDNILVKPETETADKEIIIDTDFQDVIRGRIVEIGNGIPRENNSRTPMEVRPQMIILFKRNSARKLSIEGETYFIRSQSDILVVED